VRRTALLLASMTLAVLLASGVALAMNTIQCEKRSFCEGTNERDRMLGTDEKNFMWARGDADILKGFDASDILGGEEGNDELYAGPGLDRIDPGRDNDSLYGAKGDDWYTYWTGNKWGNDNITDTAVVADNDWRTGDEVNLRSGFVNEVEKELTTNLTINLNSGSGPEVKNAAGTSTINWSDNVIENVSSYSSGDDQITGNDAANLIDVTSGSVNDVGGADVVDAGQGDDYIDVYDLEGNDTVHCGEGTDEVQRDSGDVATECENDYPW
jgi:hemolysin type calcium-binding protein